MTTENNVAAQAGDEPGWAYGRADAGTAIPKWAVVLEQAQKYGGREARNKLSFPTAEGKQHFDAWYAANAPISLRMRSVFSPIEEQAGDELMLLPCPFCGSKPQVSTNGENGYWIECRNFACGSSTMMRIALMADVKPMLYEQWNRRTDAGQLPSIIASNALQSLDVDMTDEQIVEMAKMHGEFKPSKWGTGIPQFHTGQHGVINLVRATLAKSPRPQVQALERDLYLELREAIRIAHQRANHAGHPERKAKLANTRARLDEFFDQQAVKP